MHLEFRAIGIPAMDESSPKIRIRIEAERSIVAERTTRVVVQLAEPKADFNSRLSVWLNRPSWLSHIEAIHRIGLAKHFICIFHPAIESIP